MCFLAFWVQLGSNYYSIFCCSFSAHSKHKWINKDVFLSQLQRFYIKEGSYKKKDSVIRSRRIRNHEHNGKLLSTSHYLISHLGSVLIQCFIAYSFSQWDAGNPSWLSAGNSRKTSVQKVLRNLQDTKIHNVRTTVMQIIAAEANVSQFSRPSGSRLHY